MPLEPGLALARRQGDAWQAILPDSAAWTGAMQSAPEDLFPGQARQNWLLAQAATNLALPSGPLGGYLLPWKAGLSYYLTQSVHHDRYDSSLKAHYAFDFATPYPSQMFDIYAAKGGTVKRYYDGWENGHQNPNNPNEVNFLVLEDTSTTPTTYQLYLHLAQNSIPAVLRRVGAPVMQGQFIGIADNTGNSSGNHLHFQVHTNPNSYWDQSVDITFKDVPINGGRPRNKIDLAFCQPSNTFQKYRDVCSQTSERYISGNIQRGGEIASPLTGDTIISDTVTLQGVASVDGDGLSGAQFIAQYGDSPAWQPVSTVFTTTLFTASWNMCASQVPDGPVGLALRISDADGYRMSGLPGLKQITKSYACPPPPPACTPNESQAALFARPDFQGACVVLGAGEYTTTASMNPLGVGKAESIQVGAKTQATLYAGPGLAGRGETFTRNDSSLADNLIGSDAAASVRVQARNTPPGTPAPSWPPAAASFTAGASLSLAWDNPGGAAQYQARLSRPGLVITSPLQTEPAWPLGSLAGGSYTWQVKARNNVGESAWSAARTFTIQAGLPLTSTARTLPYTQTVEAGADGWTSSSGWKIVTGTNHTPGGLSSWRYSPDQGKDYATGAANAGDLTSLPF
ncbi:MAG TPA: M23 family metallopeptidase, partial [Anaerolineales bacterium]